MDFDEQLYYFFSNDKFQLSFGFVCGMVSVWTYWILYGALEALQYVVNPNLFIIAPFEKYIVATYKIV
jgi:hypothetical protein